MTPQEQIQLLAELRTDMKWVRSILEGQDKKYSARWVQNVVTLVMSAGGVAIVGAVLGLIILKPTFAILSMMNTTSCHP